ncbi:MAG: heme exporter protein CcmD [Betaproteobacteria bacterium]|nr:heme exporter protein CcmD [Betaproteobacteria bacterium]
MQWSSLEAFVAMGGYGPYVWGSYGVTLLVMAAEVVTLARRHHAIRRLIDLRASLTETEHEEQA